MLLLLLHSGQSSLPLSQRGLRTLFGHSPAQEKEVKDRLCLQAELVLKSIGYKSVPVEGLEFDPTKGVARHQAGRVLTADDTSPDPGLYVCGWLKRGPSGIIGEHSLLVCLSYFCVCVC
jgi:NADPH-dependent glutamate synthase beta subunit-like oxidoreductase